MQDQLLFVSEWAKEHSATPDVLEQLAAPYREMLDQLYERDLPLAKLADQSDLLLHVRGPAASGPSPRVSVLTRLLTQTRDEVTKLAKQLAGVTTVHVPRTLDMTLVGVANGSLFLGFSASDAGESVEHANITRAAVETIAAVSRLVAEGAPLSEIADSVTDPAARDIAIDAVRHMSPSGQAGITEVEILGRKIHRTVSLTTDTRRAARGLLAQPATRTTEKVLFVGTVREVDLDAGRFEIRNVEGHPYDVRCAHVLEEEQVKRLVDRRVRVKGFPEFGKGGIVRLLWVDEIEELG